jgi:hypothetical protein
LNALLKSFLPDQRDTLPARLSYFLANAATGHPHDLRFAAVLWVTTRLFALWVNIVQNYWTRDRRFGYRRYDDECDNAMNISDWLPVKVTRLDQKTTPFHAATPKAHDVPNGETRERRLNLIRRAVLPAQ